MVAPDIREEIASLETTHGGKVAVAQGSSPTTFDVYYQGKDFDPAVSYDYLRRLAKTHTVKVFPVQGEGAPYIVQR